MSVDQIRTEIAVHTILSELDVLECKRSLRWLHDEEPFLAEAETRIKALRARAKAYGMETA